MTIQEKNKSIATMMGWTRVKNIDQNWNFIMWTVGFVEDLGYAVDICQDYVYIYEHSSKSSLNHLLEVEGDSKINAIFEALYQFSLLYNNGELES